MSEPRVVMAKADAQLLANEADKWEGIADELAAMHRWECTAPVDSCLPLKAYDQAKAER